MPCRVRFAPPLLVALLLLAPRAGLAWDFTIKGHELTLDVTNTLAYTYYFDNDPNEYPADGSRDFERLGKLHDDLFHQIFNKLDVSLTYGEYRAGARLDLNLFANSPFKQHCGGANEPGWCVQAPERYNNQFSAERLYLTVTRKAFDLTLGDFYASFGKGIALSLIQLDEMGQDTTIRGGKLNIHHGDLGLTILGGTINVLDVDKATGFDARWEPEPILGGRLEYNFLGKVLAGTHAVYLVRDDHREAHYFGYDAIWGAGFEVPDLLNDRLSFSGEVDLQWSLAPAKPAPGEVRQGEHAGTAVYASATLQLWDLTTLLEFKHYDEFELIGFAKEPYVQMYHLPPTLDRKKAEISEGNVNVTGFRLRLDYNVGQLGPVELLLFANYGYFHNWQEGRGATAIAGDKRIHTPFGGFELQWDASPGAGQAQASAGMRKVLDHDADDSIYRQDIHLEVSVEQAFGDHGVELKYLLLDRKKLVMDLNEWREMELTLSYKWSPRLTVALTYERQEDPTQVAWVLSDPNDPTSEQVPGAGNLFSAAIRYNPEFLPGSYVNLRIGESRGGIKCLSGICRQMPPFAGVELMLVIRR